MAILINLSKDVRDNFSLQGTRKFESAASLWNSLQVRYRGAKCNSHVQSGGGSLKSHQQVEVQQGFHMQNSSRNHQGVRQGAQRKDLDYFSLNKSPWLRSASK